MQVIQCRQLRRLSGEELKTGALTAETPSGRGKREEVGDVVVWWRVGEARAEGAQSSMRQSESGFNVLLLCYPTAGQVLNHQWYYLLAALRPASSCSDGCSCN